MQKISISLILAGCALTAGLNAQSIAEWNFDSLGSSDNVTDSQTFALAAEVGSGTLSGFHASGAADWQFNTGFASDGLGVNNWTATSDGTTTGVGGDYFEISVSTVGFEDIQLSYIQDYNNLNYAPNVPAFTLYYSTDAGANFIVSGSSYTISTATTTTNRDFSSIAALDNNADVLFRIGFDGPVPSDAGWASSLDSIVVSGTAVVPEPSAYAFIAGLLVIGLIGTRRRKQITTQLL